MEIEIGPNPDVETAWAIREEDKPEDLSDPALTNSFEEELDDVTEGLVIPYEISDSDEESDRVNTELWAAAEANILANGEHIGDVTIRDDTDEEIVILETEMFNDYTVERRSLYADTNIERLAEIQADPDQFDFSENDFSNDRIEIPFSQINDGDAGDGEEIFLALHGVVEL
ncbi:hypothetical protein GCM10009647_079880 [Streptomyces sanglieri]